MTSNAPQSTADMTTWLTRAHGQRLRRAIRPMEVLSTAQFFAHQAHHHQTRKNGVTPQIAHPMHVQLLLAQYGVTDANVLGAGMLHAALEDNPGRPGEQLLAQMRQCLPDELVQTVLMLTDPHVLPSADRKALQLDRLANAPWAVQVIKLADVVASLQEGPAPRWSPHKRQAYLAQRTQLVRDVIGGSCGRLRVQFEKALRHPQWQH